MLGVAQLRDVIYVLTFSTAISRYPATTHRRHRQLADVVITGLSYPTDIAACERTSRLYVADRDECVWRVSFHGADIQRLLTTSPPDTFSPDRLSVTSSRLLVTSRRDSQLRQFDATSGNELRRVDLPDYMKPLHAVESPTATFIVDHFNTELAQYQVSEVSTEGQVLRQFCGSLGSSDHIAVDRQGNIFVADHGRGYHSGRLIGDRDNGRILLLDAQLSLRCVIIDERQLNSRWPQRLCYMDKSRQLLVGFRGSGVMVFDVLPV